jgi:hypothetical protein
MSIETYGPSAGVGAHGWRCFWLSNWCWKISTFFSFYKNFAVISKHFMRVAWRTLQKRLSQGRRAMAQAVSRQLLTTEAQGRSRVKSMWDLWWTKWHWDRFFSELSVFPCQFHSTGAPLLVKLGKKNCSSLSSSQGCTIRLEAAVRP